MPISLQNHGATVLDPFCFVTEHDFVLKMTLPDNFGEFASQETASRCELVSVNSEIPQAVKNLLHALRK